MNALVVSLLASMPFTSSQAREIAHDAEYYILEAQHVGGCEHCRLLGSGQQECEDQWLKHKRLLSFDRRQVQRSSFPDGLPRP